MCQDILCFKTWHIRLVRVTAGDTDDLFDPGSSKKPRGEGAKTRRSRDGTWAKKGNETHFGYKLHQKTDIDYCLIREIETTTASLHDAPVALPIFWDSQVDLSTKDEIVLRDRGYFGAEAKGIDFTMKRRTSEKPLGELDKERNRLISKLRSPGERPHAVIKRVFGMGRVLVTTVKRVHVELMVTAFAFDLFQLCTLKKAKVILTYRKPSKNRFGRGIIQ